MDWQPGTARPMTEDDLGKWLGRIDAAERIRKQHEPTWDKALKRYTATKADTQEVNPLLEVRHVESKKAQLFYQTPEVQLHPIDPSNPEVPTDALLPVRQKVLNDRLGPDGTNVKRTVHEALFDCLAPSGLLCTEIGYDVRMAPLPPMADPVADPAAGDASEAPAPEAGAEGEAVAAPVMPQQIPVWGKAYWLRFSPKKALVPSDWRSTDYDAAAWLGVGPLRMPLPRAKREFGLPADFEATASVDDSSFEHTEQTIGDAQGEPMVEYYKIWYRAEIFDETIVNPELYRLLIVVKGHSKPAKHVDSPFQMVDPMGQLTPGSMRGNPIHLGALRDLSDSAYVPSDLAIMEQLSAELGKYRTGLIRNRVARSPITVIDPDGFEPGEIEKIKNGQKVIFCKPGTLMANPGGVIVAANVGQEPRDNYTAQEIIERDVQQAMGTSNSTSGQLQQQKRTATEVRAASTGSNARAEAEKDRLREWFIAGVRKFDSVLLFTMTPQDLVNILGQQGAALWEQWRQLAGCYVYKILPDSGVHVDAAQFRAQKLDEYNLLRKDPQVNASELLKGVIRALGYDSAKMVLEQAPESGPEPMKTSMAVKGEDLIGPQSQAVVEILAQMGITISPGAIESLIAGQQQQLLLQAAEATTIGESGATHGGSANKTEPVNQHARQNTGGIQGVGAAA